LYNHGCSTWAGGAGGAGGDGGNCGQGWLYNHKGLVVLVVFGQVLVVMVVVVVQPGCSTWIVVYLSPSPRRVRLFVCEGSFGTFGSHILPLFSA
jgi:hypothetical protein